MFARVSTIMSEPSKVDDVIKFIDKSVKGLEEMKGAYLLVNHKSGKMLTITFWETEEAINASTSAANEIRKQAVESAAAPPPIVEIYEVALKQ